ncbi:MAG: carbohydrate kinase, partial [Bacteroidales bacterium]|nr:carbohydrate kinase [Bacteroidales bacterium]
MYLLGIDLGSSSVKASILNIETGESMATAFSPDVEMNMFAKHPGWAEQHPETWVENCIAAIKKIKDNTNIDLNKIQAIGISYQMHGLVLVDNKGEVLRPSIIWCDSRAVEIGNKAFSDLGEDYCLGHLLNSPGNFTASKLRWVYNHEQELYSKIHKVMLPGDYLAFRLTNEINTTESGLSEGIMWDYKENKVAGKLLEHYHIKESLIPPVVPTFSIQG